jgi:hypothetical protein
LVLALAHSRQSLVHLAALGAVADDLVDSLLDAHPVVELRNRSSSLVDAAVLLVVDLSSELVLLLGIRYDLLALEPQLLWLVVVARCDLVVGRGTTETALLCPICAVGVLSVLEIEADLVEALFCDVLVVLTKISTVDDGVD